MQEIPLPSLGQKFPWRRDSTPTPVFLGFPCGSAVKESTCSVGDLGWEDPLDDGMATYFSILAWRIPMDREVWQITVHRITKSRTSLSN